MKSMSMKFLRAGFAGLLCLATATMAFGQPGGAYQDPGKPVGTAAALINCHATFFRSGTGISYTAPSWQVTATGTTDNDKMDACKKSATQNWLANGKILWHLNYSSGDQDKICRSGKVEVRIDYGWQNPNSRGRQPSFTYQVSSPQCTCTCSRSTDTFVPTEKKCATRISSASGINNGPLGGGWYGINGSLYQLNSSQYSCAFNMVTRGR
jgi:hypothetical protein